MVLRHTLMCGPEMERTLPTHWTRLDTETYLSVSQKSGLVMGCC